MSFNSGLYTGLAFFLIVSTAWVLLLKELTKQMQIYTEELFETLSLQKGKVFYHVTSHYSPPLKIDKYPLKEAAAYREEQEAEGPLATFISSLSNMFSFRGIAKC